MNKLTLALLGTFVVMLLVSGAFAYMFREQPAADTAQATATASPSPGDKVGSSRVDLQACKLEYSIVSPK